MKATLRSYGPAAVLTVLLSGAIVGCTGLKPKPVTCPYVLPDYVRISQLEEQVKHLQDINWRTYLNFEDRLRKLEHRKPLGVEELERAKK